MNQNLIQIRHGCIPPSGYAHDVTQNQIIRQQEPSHYEAACAHRLTSQQIIRQPKRNDSIRQGLGKNRGASHSTPTTPRHQNPRNSVLTYQNGRQPLRNRWTGHQHPGKTNSTKRTKLSIHQVPTRKRNQIYSRNKMDMENCLCLGTPDTLQACCYRQRRIYSGSESREICTLHKEFSSGRHTPYTASNFVAALGR